MEVIQLLKHQREWKSFSDKLITKVLIRQGFTQVEIDREGVDECVADAIFDLEHANDEPKYL